MKTFTFLVLFLFSIAVLQAQDYLISFTGSGQSTTIDSIQVKNLTQGTVLSLDGDDVLNLVETIGINTLTANESKVKIYPNPMVESTFIEFVNSKTELVCLKIFNETGILIAKQSTSVQQGSQRFKISGLNAGVYTVNVSAADWKYAAKLISLRKSAGNTAIEYQVTDEGPSPENATKSTKDLVQMQYNDGEMILCKGFAGNYARVLTLLPTQSQTLNYEFILCSDEDGNNYAVVTIGTQTWMAENLNYTTSNSWTYDDDPAYGDIYGRLYTWDAALTACPSGWSLPSDEEWDNLVDFLGGSDVAGGKIKEAGTTHWGSPNTGATNSSGFTALPGGNRLSSGIFNSPGSYGNWLSSTEYSGTELWFRYLYYGSSQVGRHDCPKAYGLSVRCLKN